MKALHLFAGIGGGALGFQRAGFETVGAVDFDASACRDFELLVGRPCTHGDLSTMSPAELASAWEQLAKYSAADHPQGDASVDTGHSPVSAGLPVTDGDDASPMSADAEICCTRRGAT